MSSSALEDLMTVLGYISQTKTFPQNVEDAMTRLKNRVALKQGQDGNGNNDSALQVSGMSDDVRPSQRTEEPQDKDA